MAVGCGAGGLHTLGTCGAPPPPGNIRHSDSPPVVGPKPRLSPHPVHFSENLKQTPSVGDEASSDGMRGPLPRTSPWTWMANSPSTLTPISCARSVNVPHWGESLMQHVIALTGTHGAYGVLRSHSAKLSAFRFLRLNSVCGVGQLKCDQNGCLAGDKSRGLEAVIVGLGGISAAFFFLLELHLCVAGS